MAELRDMVSGAALANGELEVTMFRPWPSRPLESSFIIAVGKHQLKLSHEEAATLAAKLLSGIE